jgi:DNA-binding CsgD family transcriptional regulator
VAVLVAQGLSNPAIAELLQIQPRTVTSHLEHIFDKLHIRSRSELVRMVVLSEKG